MYHGEDAQEDFLVLSGECLLLVEGDERPLRAWDFFHSPAWTEHVLVGAGDGPCVVVGAGARKPDSKVLLSAQRGRRGPRRERPGDNRFREGGVRPLSRAGGAALSGGRPSRLVMRPVAKLLVPISALLLGFWLIMTVVSIDHGWTAEFTDVGNPDDVSGEWVTRGTLFSPPLAAMLAQAALTALALVRRRVPQLVAGAGLALLGCLYIVGGLGEPFDPVASDPHLAVSVLLRITGLAGAGGLVAAGVATVNGARRRSR